MKQAVKILYIKFIFFLTRKFSGHSDINFKNLLILAPHPDDEILGMGGVILESLKQSGKVHLVYMTDGEGSGTWTDKEEIKRQRTALSEHVRLALGIPAENITRLHLHDGAVNFPGQAGFGNAVLSIQRLIDSIKPDAVFATHFLDFWPYDHVACACIAREAVRNSSFRTKLFYYWVWTWYNLRPWQLFHLSYKNMIRADIRQQLVLKRELSGIYLNPLTPEGRPWSGVLPRALVKALDQPFEIIEIIDI